MNVVETKRMFAVAMAAILGLIWAATPVAAHCDAVDGPVARDVNMALNDGELDRVLKWVEAEDEAQVRQVFEQARRVRSLGDEPALLADRHFLETVVRLHRQSEGAPYTGLQPAGLPLHPTVRAVDVAMAEGSIDGLIDRLQQHVNHAVRSRFDQAHAAAKHEQETRAVAQGRAAVHAYVELVHYVKHLHDLLSRESGSDATGHGGHGAGGHSH